MKLKILKLKKGPMILTGSKVLELIQDEYTPAIDLLVRESIQNSADAILENKDFGKIEFITGKFSKSLFSSKFDEIDDNINLRFDGDEFDFLAISDSNTCGLLGDSKENENGGPNNLYNLVYDVMNKKTGMFDGGSHGIGKSIYYRYGIGICLFYSRTFENGSYIHKLAGALIQNEKNDECLLGKNTSGIAYFGNILNNESFPIYDEKEIIEFLNVFGIEPYSGDKTGTIVIIPFINKCKMLDDLDNYDEKDSCFWTSNFELALKISIQRWYFARLNNENFNGKYLKVAINKKIVQTEYFFNTLQQLYNGTLIGIETLDVTSKKLPDNELGKFNYKVFSREELSMNPPINWPSPKLMVDSSNDVNENGLLFYIRKSGMVINYQNDKFGNYSLDDDKYLIGVFILNDDVKFNGERLGEYFRKSEEANHKEWNDINNINFPYLKNIKPFKQICKTIKNKLSDEFKKTTAISLEGSNTALQRKLGQLLMPPSGYGNEAENPGGNGGSGKSSKKEKKVKTLLSKIENDGHLIYENDIILKPNESISFRVSVKAGGKSYSFDKWEQSGFMIPCEINRFGIIDVSANGKKLNSPQNIPLDENFVKRRIKKVEGLEIYKVRGLATSKMIPCGLKVQNCMNEKITFKLIIEIKPLDNKLMINFDNSFSEGTI